MKNLLNRLKRRLSGLRGAGNESPAEKHIRKVIEPYFSRSYYLEVNSDVCSSGVDPLEHYVKWGAKEGRQPCADFDPSVYWARFDPDHENPFYDAITHGRYPSEDGFVTESTFTEEDERLRVVRLDEKASHTLVGKEPKFPIGREASAGETVNDEGALAAHLSANNAEGEQRFVLGPLSPQDVELVAANMDEDWYRQQYPEASGFGGSMVAYYLALGWVQGHDPSPAFSTRYYLQENKDIARGGVNPFVHYLKHGQKEKWRRTASVTEAAIFEAFADQLAGDLAEAIELDPMVALPLNRRTITSPLDVAAPIRQALKQFRQDLADKPYPHVVLIPQVRLSGAARVAGIYATTLAEQVGADNVLVVRTDGQAFEHPEWFPAGVRTYNLAEFLEPIQDKPTRAQLLFDLLRGVEAEALHLFNSRLGWDMLETMGRKLSQELSVTAYLFTWEEAEDGRKVGYPIQWLRETIHYCDTILCDSLALAQHISDRFALPKQGKGAPIVALTPATLPNSAAFEARIQKRALREPTNKVLWAGRLDRQKRPDILAAVASSMPRTQFEVYGSAVLTQHPDALDHLPNLTLMGEYKNLAEVVSRDYDAFLYTAQWDGLPTILLDIVGHGLPIVASRIGGVGELINDDTGWPIHDIEDIDAYRAALNEAIANPEGAMARAQAAYAHAKATYTPDHYAQAVSEGLNRAAPAAEAQDLAEEPAAAPARALKDQS